MPAAGAVPPVPVLPPAGAGRGSTGADAAHRRAVHGPSVLRQPADEPPSRPGRLGGRPGPGAASDAEDGLGGDLLPATLQPPASGPSGYPYLLGSVRKSMSLLDRPGGEPVRSLRYFASLLEEVVTESFPDSYWQHLEFNLRRCERLWQQGPAAAAGSARPDLEQADPSRGARRPSSAAEAEREERG